MPWGVGAPHFNTTRRFFRRKNHGPDVRVANFNGQKPVIDPNDAVMLLIDHQSGLFQTVKDLDMPSLRAHATALARMATLAKLQWAEIYAMIFPPYQLLIESYARAQDVVKNHEALDSQRAATAV